MEPPVGLLEAATLEAKNRTERKQGSKKFAQTKSKKRDFAQPQD
jgi:hypothetical protein